MDNKESELLVKAIQHATMSGESLLTGKVIAVDEDENTCDVDIDGDAPVMFGVRLRAVVDTTTDGIIQIPAIDSAVLIGKLTTSLWCVLVFSQIHKYKFKIDSQTLIIDADGFVFNEGNLGGMVKIEALVDKLNAIENRMNELETNYKTHNHAHPQGPTTAFVVPYTSASLVITNKADLENEKIKQ